MKRIVSILVLSAFFLVSPGKYGQAENKSFFLNRVFGMMIMHGANSTPVTFAILGIDEKGIIVHQQPVTMTQFILMASGKIYSPANPDTLNLFEKFKITECTPEYDASRKKYFSIDCPLFYEVWKYRYLRDPFNADKRQNTGWSKSIYNPSQGQMQMLRDSFGLKSFTDYVKGDSIFRMLYSLRNDTFELAYRNS